MQLLTISLKNFKRNLSFYALYLFSVALVVTVFFSFTSFSMNEVMLERMSNDGRVENMCQIISIFLILFVVFYMSYSNRFFLRRRTKELGIYTLLGYQKKTILLLLTFENLFICLSAFVIGIILGGFVHKGIIVFLNVLIHLGIPTSTIPFFNPMALLKTLLFVCAVLVVLIVSNGIFLYKVSLMQLIRFEKSAEPQMLFRKFPALLGLIMILTGYLLSLDILRVRQSIWIKVGFYPVGLITMFLIIIGTALFITAFLPYLLNKLKSHKKQFYTRYQIITIPNFIYRIRSNAKTLVMLTLLSAATLTISSVMALTLYYPIAAMSRMVPSEIEFRLDQNTEPDTIHQLISSYTLDELPYTLNTTKLYKVTSDSNDLPLEYSIGSSNKKQNTREPSFECLSYSQYKTLLEAQNRTKVLNNLPALEANECILLKYQVSSSHEQDKQYVLNLNHTQETVRIKSVSYDNVISFANSVGTLVVSDTLYEKISQNQLPFTSIISLNGKAIQNNEALYEAISNYLHKSPYLQGHSHRINEIMHFNSSTFLLIGFLVVLFFIAVGSILYFNNISSIMDSKADYEILGKIGYTKAQLKKLIQKQVLTFYSIPFFLGLLDCFFAILVYKTGLMQNLLKGSLIQYLPIFLAILITFFIYGIYYKLTVKSCTKMIFNEH